MTDQEQQSSADEYNILSKLKKLYTRFFKRN